MRIGFKTQAGLTCIGVYACGEVEVEARSYAVRVDTELVKVVDALRTGQIGDRGAGGASTTTRVTLTFVQRVSG